MNALEGLSIWHYMFQLCNLTQLQISRKTGLIHRNIFLQIYSVIVILAAICVLLLGIFSPLNAEEAEYTVDFIQLIAIRLAHIVSIVESFLRWRGEEQLLRSILEIDRLFEVSMNVDIKNNKCRSTLLNVAGLMLILYLGSKTLIFFTIISEPRTEIFYLIYYSIPSFYCGLRYFQFMFFIIIVQQRLNELIEILKSINLVKIQELDKEFDSVMKITLNNKKTKKNYKNTNTFKLFIAREVYNRLWEFTSSLNHCFGLSILANIGNDFLSITSDCYWTFLNLNNPSPEETDSIPGTIAWSIPHLVNVITVALLCHKTAQSIEQFSLQLLHQNIKFTAYGFFTIDCTLLYTIVGAITTYLIILIQFYMTEQKDNVNSLIPNVTNITR